MTDFKNGKPTAIEFDRGVAAVANDPRAIAWAMSVLVHEFVHVERGDPKGDEGEAYYYQQMFLDQLLKSGFLTQSEYDQVRSHKDSAVSNQLEGKGGGKQKVDACEECIKFGLNPNGTWGIRTPAADLDRFRGVP